MLLLKATRSSYWSEYNNNVEGVMKSKTEHILLLLQIYFDYQNKHILDEIKYFNVFNF